MFHFLYCHGLEIEGGSIKIQERTQERGGTIIICTSTLMLITESFFALPSEAASSGWIWINPLDRERGFPKEKGLPSVY